MHVNIELLSLCPIQNAHLRAELYRFPYVLKDKWLKKTIGTLPRKLQPSVAATFEAETDGQKSLFACWCVCVNVWQRTPECKHIDLPMGCLLHRVTLPMVFGSKLITHDEMINLVYVPLSVWCARPYAVLFFPRQRGLSAGSTNRSAVLLTSRVSFKTGVSYSAEHGFGI